MKKSLLTLSVLCSAGMLQAQIITTIAGSGTNGFIGNGGPATAAQFNYPNGVAVDNSGNVYVSDFNNAVVWKVNTSGSINIVAGNGTLGYGGDGAAATAANLDKPCKLAADAAGNLYVTDWGNNRLRKISGAGIISTVAGDGTGGYSGNGGPATSAQLLKPESLSRVDASGNIYIGEQENDVIRKVSSTGIISTIVGNGAGGYSGDGGPATAATIDYPRGIAFDNFGNFYIADWNNKVIRKINSSGIISTIAGTGTAGYSGDGGPATAAQINGPTGMAVDYDGSGGVNIYFADELNAVIRKINAAGIISTIVGTGVQGYNGDGGAATASKLNFPVDIAIDSHGDLYIADAYNYRIRKVTMSTASVTTDKPANTFIRIYPNPALDYCIIETPESKSSPVIQVMDIVGRIVTTKICPEAGAQKIRLDLAGLAPGNYVVKVVCGETIYRDKLVVW